VVPEPIGQATPDKRPGLVLPLQILTAGDISRLARELESLEAFFEGAALKGAEVKAVPEASLQLSALNNENQLNLLHSEDRLRLLNFLSVVRAKAPLVHVSFASDPKTDFLMKLVSWFRSNAHPYVLLQVGLQPNIAAGCIVRTTNKYFDLSFKQHFAKSKAKLAAALRTAQ